MLPILYQSPELILYSYPLLMGLGWGVAYEIFFGRVPADVPRLRAQLLFWGVFVFSWAGAKVLFYLTLPADLSKTLLSELSFWTGGGFVFYGGFLGAVAFLLLYRATGHRLTPELLWAILPSVAIGHGIGRIGCFLAGCCYGEKTEFLWGVFLHGAHRHPTQLIEALSLLVLGTYLYRSTRPRLELLVHYLCGYGALRLVVEALRGDLVRGKWGAFTPSQWISIMLIFFGLILLLRIRGPRRSNT